MRPYRLGKRQAAVDQTRVRILAAARDLVASGAPATLAAVARKAAVSRITVYNSFGSKHGLLSQLAPSPTSTPPTAEDSPRDQVRRLVVESSSRWAASPALFRHLPALEDSNGERERRLAERLANADALRPGCSIKEAEDVLCALTSFPVFDRLHRDGRRQPVVVAEILMRLAAAILA